jgi:hypothetical protein
VAVEFRPAGKSDRTAILELFEAAFKTAASPADLAWKYDDNPHPALSALAIEDGRALGFIGALGTRYRGEGIDRQGNSVVDVMTRPDTRSLGRAGLFKRLGEVFRRINADAGTLFDFGFPHERARKIEERLFGCVMSEPCGERGRPLAAPPLLGRLRRRLLRVTEGEPFGRGHEGLAERLHARPGWRTDRSRRTLSWRYSRPGFAYRTFQLLDWRGDSRGYAAVAMRDARALLVDQQVASETDGTLADLLAAVHERLRDAPARRLVLRSPLDGVLGRRLVEELGFLPEPSDTVLLMHPIADGFDFLAPGSTFDYRFSDHDVF